MDIFSTVGFAVFGLIAVGASWCLIGAVLGRAPKEGLDASFIAFAGALVSVLAGLVIELSTRVRCPCSRSVLFGTLAVYLAAGVINYCGLLAMSAGMQRGPNGVVWGISQSALVAPFASGILFFGSKATPCNLAGVASLLVGLAFYSRAKGDCTIPAPARDPRLSWRFFAFLAFGCFAVQQSLATAPSYFEECRDVSPVLRSVASAAGSLLSFAFILARRARREPIIAPLAAQWRRGRLWAYVLSMQFFGLVFAYTLLYPGMDTLARHGAGAASYPLMVASCLAAFTLYARFFLHERAGRDQMLALIFSILGLALVAIPSVLG